MVRLKHDLGRVQRLLLREHGECVVLHDSGLLDSNVRHRGA